MHLSRTLAFYIGRNFAAWCGVTYAALIGLIMLLEIIELLRRAASRDVGTGLILEMALLKLPHMTMEIAPFVILLGAMLSFSHLTRTQELIIVRGAGLSVWQFLIPPLIVAFVAGCFLVTIFSPLASATVLRFEYLDRTHLKGQSSLIRIAKSGLWLRQADEDGQSVIHAARFDPGTLTLEDATLIFFDSQGRFVERKDADRGGLEDGHWLLHNVWTAAPDTSPYQSAHEMIETDLTAEKIKDNFSPPATMSFWDLPGFIRSMDEAGFSAKKHRIHWHGLLSEPFLFCAMVLVAAVFSMRMSRFGGVIPVAATGVILGFVFYFLTDVVHAMGSVGTLPVMLAVWSPVAIVSFLGLAFLMHREDG